MCSIYRLQQDDQHLKNVLLAYLLDDSEYIINSWVCIIFINNICYFTNSLWFWRDARLVIFFKGHFSVEKEYFYFYNFCKHKTWLGRYEVESNLLKHWCCICQILFGHNYCKMEPLHLDTSPWASSWF